MDNSVEVLFDKLIKVENENNGYGLATFLVWHEAYGYFKVTEEIESDEWFNVATYYKNELQGTTYDFCSKSADEWESLYEATDFCFVNLD